MGWASHYISQLVIGIRVQFRPRGNSMRGKINSGQLVTVSPDLTDLKVGDVVLCKVHGAEYLHLIKAVQKKNRYQIGNNIGGTNGWISIDNIFGRVIRIED